jgi:bacillithiol biosynthesis cysteine-adding enzyme BshC
MDHPKLKARFLQIMKRELFQRPSMSLIKGEQKKLEELGYKPQALARDINLFYLTEDFRERIEWNGDHFEIVNQDLTFTEDEMIEELESHPERFSPNVCLRPVYQEYILPNLAYVGGGGEIAYWLERKTQFEEFDVNFPMLIRRNSLLWIDNKLSKDMREIGLDIQDLFKDTDTLINNWIHANSGSTVEYDEELKRIESAFDSLSKKAEALDPTLKKAIEAEKVRQLKSAEQLGKRLIRAEKANHEQSVNKIRKIRDKLFPDQSLQERYDNFIPFYLKYGRQFIDILLRELSPFEKGLIVVEDHE